MGNRNVCIFSTLAGGDLPYVEFIEDCGVAKFNSASRLSSLPLGPLPSFFRPAAGKQFAETLHRRPASNPRMTRIGIEKGPGRGGDTISPKPSLSRLALAGFVVSVVAVASAAGSGLGTRAGWLDFQEGFRFLRWGAYFGAADRGCRHHPMVRLQGRRCYPISPAANGGSVLDVRSVSRVGLSDLGTNASRIRTFLKTFSNAAMAGSP